MSQKFIKITTCVCFFIFSCGLCYVSLAYFQKMRGAAFRARDGPTLTIFGEARSLQCGLRDHHEDWWADPWPPKLAPSLESFIRASSTVEGQELRLSGLAVYSNLSDSCQPPADVSKSNIHVDKIALISIANNTVCPLQDLVVNSQNAGYSVVIYFNGHELQHGTDNHDKLVIPVLRAVDCFDRNKNTNIYPSDDNFFRWIADRSDVEIRVDVSQNTLMTMRGYLAKLDYWFLLGPLITLEWLRRTKKFCCMSGGQQVNEEPGTENEETVNERTLHSVVDENQENNNQESQETENEETGGEEQPLIVVVNDCCTNVTTTSTEHTRSTTIKRVTALFREIFGKFAVGCGYVILIIAALPVGISSGGWSFFRFDENENAKQKSFWDDLLKFDINDDFSFVMRLQTFIPISIFYSILPLLWSSFQIFCFFLYSRFACNTTWTVPTNFSKLIRSDWFASNMYLLILGVVVPYCSFNFNSPLMLYKFIYFATYNTVCSICNLLFIIILNKHKFATRYVFYISVCMICAYVESDIIAVFYFMLNSEGSLINLKLTALRTVAIGLTLTLSFSTSMHIIRKLTKPQESLFEGLGEK